MTIQREIATWARETFPNAALIDVYDKFEDELDELYEAVWAQDDPVMVGRELADVAILLYQIANRYCIDLDGEIASKLAVNRARTWTPVGDGTYQHEEAAS